MQQVDERHHLGTGHRHRKHGVRRVQGGGEGRLPGKMFKWFEWVFFDLFCGNCYKKECDLISTVLSSHFLYN